MKINHTNRLQQLNNYRAQIDRNQKIAEQNNAKAKDRVDISPEAKKMQGNPITAARNEKVEALKKQVESGDYKVNPQAVAEKFLAYWQGVGSVKHDDK
ncbi:negative regulator of flagellin synthesis FlgM [Pullulanibacillus pueri]|uniref:Negative regulator of flagellin synthesis n=1 Tax=Pullulanibacillus pueri TaxID=1437324 RepID=A0A8J2ZU57_9BACL|nr:flagellar biosynthesis anti-sigma factor FlgM [Pullulanibacillus pueri]MBM7684122.1 negative regulator of flagellin synthesis FlgM [Pullulanibacillus pueri]GGH76696.1 hypothetical protein GCM10007096_07510 [Pullulanibacillus pueri]